MKKKGFTLIELLAVIVVLAIIALITVPLIISVVDKSKKNAFEDSAYGIIEAGRLYYMEHIGEKETLDRYDFEIENKKFVLKEDKTKELKFTGTMPKTGMLQLHSNGDIAVSICNSSYCACKSASELKVTIKDMNCKINSETGEVEDTESISEIKLKELEENMNNLQKEVTSLKTENSTLNQQVTNLEKKKVAVGTVISYMGKNVPEGYLACDGKVYNISAYKDLADQIKREFGSYTKFGGNGTTTFGVPDLRGEFLRGTGSNAHTNTATGQKEGSGAGVGEHQQATSFVNLRMDEQNIYVTSENSNSFEGILNRDSTKITTSRFSREFSEKYKSTQNIDVQSPATSRPTNTSVLYAIKY